MDNGSCYNLRVQALNQHTQVNVISIKEHHGKITPSIVTLNGDLSLRFGYYSRGGGGGIYQVKLI